jgi:hypothetical protein
MLKKTHARRSWSTGAVALALAWAAMVAVRADHEPRNTGMADASAFVNAFDRATAGDAGTVQILSLSNLRGLSSEPLNAGGSVRVDLTTGAVTSTVQLLPLDGVFDLWLVDNRPGPDHTTLADPSDVVKPVGAYVFASGSTRCRSPWGQQRSQTSSQIARLWCGRARIPWTRSC